MARSLTSCLLLATVALLLSCSGEVLMRRGDQMVSTEEFTRVVLVEIDNACWLSPHSTLRVVAERERQGVVMAEVLLIDNSDGNCPVNRHVLVDKKVANGWANVSKEERRRANLRREMEKIESSDRAWGMRVLKDLSQQ